MSDYEIRLGDCVEGMQELEANSIDAIVTSPPYDGIRHYAQGNSFDLPALGKEIERCLKPGGFAAVVIADQKKAKRLSLTTARLMIDWCDNAGLGLCDWLIYERDGRPGKFHSFRRDHESILVFFAGEEPGEIDTKSLKRKARHPMAGKVHSYSMRDDDITNRKTKVVKENTACSGSVWKYRIHERFYGHFDHPAKMHPDLARDLVIAFSKPGDLVFDPFTGTGTTGMVAVEEHRRFLGTEISPDYAAMARQRLAETQPKLIL